MTTLGTKALGLLSGTFALLLILLALAATACGHGMAGAGDSAVAPMPAARYTLREGLATLEGAAQARGKRVG